MRAGMNREEEETLAKLVTGRSSQTSLLHAAHRHTRLAVVRENLRRALLANDHARRALLATSTAGMNRDTIASVVLPTRLIPGHCCTATSGCTFRRLSAPPTGLFSVPDDDLWLCIHSGCIHSCGAHCEFAHQSADALTCVLTHQTLGGPRIADGLDKDETETAISTGAGQSTERRKMRIDRLDGSFERSGRLERALRGYETERKWYVDAPLPAATVHGRRILTPAEEKHRAITDLIAEEIIGVQRRPSSETGPVPTPLPSLPSSTTDAGASVPITDDAVGHGDARDADAESLRAEWANSTAPPTATETRARRALARALTETMAVETRAVRAGIKRRREDSVVLFPVGAVSLQSLPPAAVAALLTTPASSSALLPSADPPGSDSETRRPRGQIVKMIGRPPPPFARPSLAQRNAHAPPALSHPSTPASAALIPMPTDSTAVVSAPAVELSAATRRILEAHTKAVVSASTGSPLSWSSSPAATAVVPLEYEGDRAKSIISTALDSPRARESVLIVTPRHAQSMPSNVRAIKRIETAAQSSASKRRRRSVPLSHESRAALSKDERVRRAAALFTLVFESPTSRAITSSSQSAVGIQGQIPQLAEMGHYEDVAHKAGRKCAQLWTLLDKSPDTRALEYELICLHLFFEMMKKPDGFTHPLFTCIGMPSVILSPMHVFGLELLFTRCPQEGFRFHLKDLTHASSVINAFFRRNPTAATHSRPS